jgi:hypothetical protein
MDEPFGTPAVSRISNADGKRLAEIVRRMAEKGHSLPEPSPDALRRVNSRAKLSAAERHNLAVAITLTEQQNEAKARAILPNYGKGEHLESTARRIPEDAAMLVLEEDSLESESLWQNGPDVSAEDATPKKPKPALRVINGSKKFDGGPTTPMQYRAASGINVVIEWPTDAPAPEPGGEPKPSNDEIIRRIRSGRCEGKTFQQLSDEVGLSKEMVRRLLRQYSAAEEAGA